MSSDQLCNVRALSDFYNETGAQRHFYYPNTLFHVNASTEEAENLIGANKYDAYGKQTFITDRADANTIVNFTASRKGSLYLHHRSEPWWPSAESRIISGGDTARPNPENSHERGLTRRELSVEKVGEVAWKGGVLASTLAIVPP